MGSVSRPANRERTIVFLAVTVLLVAPAAAGGGGETMAAREGPGLGGEAATVATTVALALLARRR